MSLESVALTTPQYARPSIEPVAGERMHTRGELGGHDTIGPNAKPMQRPERTMGFSPLGKGSG